MSGHTIRWTLQPAAVVATVECHEPEGADCRRACDCEHTPDPVEVCEVCRAPIRVIDCNPREWIENTDGWVGHYGGDEVPMQDGAIIYVWDGDDWTWRYAQEDTGATDVGDAYILGYVAGVAAGAAAERKQIEWLLDDLADYADDHGQIGRRNILDGVRRQIQGGVHRNGGDV